ncbi:MAG: enoyl-CoA hydratase, partial [Chitinophagia bacterium]|nr:enoyl-CoA hydratase [Chitinophagia bacterium]
YKFPEIKSVIITGAGLKSFVAGADIKEFESLNKEEATAVAKKGQNVFFKIENSPKPVVACVNGFALGGGCELAMACHFIIASESAVFGQPEVNLGIMVGYGGSQRLTQRVGKGRAMELVITGKTINATQAMNYGLVNYVVPQTELIDKAFSILRVCHEKAPIAVGNSIKAVNAVWNEDVNGYDKEATLFGECFVTEDCKEGIQAFIDKRKPHFKGH